MILGLIPARGGSKGIPRKNLADLGGAPLISHTLAAAMAAKRLDHVAVSTDDATIAAVARKLGVDVIMRPPALAADKAPMLGAVRHAVQSVEAQMRRPVSAVVLLQPTSPFRKAAHVDAAVKAFRESDGESLLSVHRVSEHPCECVQVGPRGLTPALRPPRGHGRQSFPPFFYINGAIYVTSRRMLFGPGKFWDKRSALYEMPILNGLDIDEPAQLETARALLARDAFLSSAAPRSRRKT
jgi:CMP-N-acetylneuraminic acid synthetase